MYLVVLLSGLFNAVSPLNLLNYITSDLNWLIFLIILTKISLTKDGYQSIIALIFVIIAVNSILAFFQVTLLPIHVAPDGYVPHINDVAIGLLGVGSSQYLTILCLGFSFYFIYNYLNNGNKNNVIYAAIFLLQPAISESKAAIIIVGVIFIISLIWAKFNYIFQLSFKEIFRFALILGLIIIGYNTYRSAQYKFFLTTEMPSTFKFFEQKRTLEDYRKIVGYIEAITEVAPSGNAGYFVGSRTNKFYK